MEEKLREERAKTTVDEFNRNFPVGSRILWRSINRQKVEYKEMVVKHAAVLVNYQPIAFLEGKVGFVSIEPGFIDYEGSLYLQK